jgi:Tfp pilus assembly protein PilV
MKARVSVHAFSGERGWSLLETLFSIIVLGMGIMVFMRMQNRSSEITRTNANLHNAARIIEKHVESLRARIAQNPSVYWPPRDTSYQDPVYTNITLVRTVNGALSPRDGASLPTVRKIDLVVAWGNHPLDTIRITTYVSKSF